MLGRTVLRRVVLLHSYHGHVHVPSHSALMKFSAPCIVKYSSVPTNAANNHNHKVKEKTDKHEKKKIQGMPSRLTRLISDTKVEGWPTLNNMSILAQKCHLAGVNMDQVEEFLVTHFRSKSKNTPSKKREPNFYSKHLLVKWQNKKYETLEKFLNYVGDNIYNQSEKIGQPIKRLEYCMAMWRLAAVIEDCFVNEQEEALRNIELFADKFLLKDDTLKILIILGKLGHKKQLHLNDIPSVLKIVELLSAKNEVMKSPSSIMPNLVLFTDSAQQVDAMLSLDLATSEKIRLQITKCRICWKLSHFSASLDSLAAATEGFLDLSQTALTTSGEEESFLSLALPLVEIWRELVLTAAQQGLTPAMDYMMTVAEMSAKRGTNLSLLPGYVMWLAVKDGKSHKDLADKLETGVSARLRGDKFERCFIVEGMTQETKQFFVKDYVRRLLLDSGIVPLGTMYKEQERVKDVVPETHSVEASTSTTSEPVKEDLPPGISQQLIDITVMELAACSKVPEMMDIIITEQKKGSIPSPTTIKAVIELLCDIGDLYNLDQLARVLPSNSAEQEDIYLAVGKIKLRSVNSSWESGKKLVSWIKLVELYRQTWADRAKGSIQLQTGRTVLDKCHSYAKLFVEESVLTSNNELLPAIQTGAMKVLTDHGDLALLLVYWEALFFGPEFQQQQVAETLLNSVPQLVDHIHIDKVLERCRRYRTESHYRRLLEICLKYQCPPYTQSRVFEEMLAHQTRSNNLAGANETIKCAKSLDIKITADFLQDYLNAKKEMDTRTQNSLLNKVKTLIFRTPNK